MTNATQVTDAETRRERQWASRCAVTEQQLAADVADILKDLRALKSRVNTNTPDNIDFRCRCHRAADAAVGKLFRVEIEGVVRAGRIEACKYRGQRVRTATAIAQFEVTLRSEAGSLFFATVESLPR